MLSTASMQRSTGTFLHGSLAALLFSLVLGWLPLATLMPHHDAAKDRPGALPRVQAAAHHRKPPSHGPCRRPARPCRKNALPSPQLEERDDDDTDTDHAHARMRSSAAAPALASGRDHTLWRAIRPDVVVPADPGVPLYLLQLCLLI